MTTEKTRADRVREYLEAGPQPMEQIRLAMGLTTKQAHSTVGDLRRLGFVESTGPVRSRVYSLTTKIHRALSQEERTRRARERKRAKRRAEGRMTKAEYLAQISAKAEARKAEKLAEKQAATDARKEQRRKAAEMRRQQRDALKAEERRQARDRKASQQTREQRAAKKLSPALAALAKSAERRSAKEQPSCQKREAPQKTPAKIETVEEWMARTGAKVEQLPLGEVSKPLQFIGHRALNEASWRDRA